MKVRVVGVDCATDYAKVGLAAGEFDGRRLRVEKVTRCQRDMSPAETICSWIENEPGPVLLAMDAPLGWPEPMGRSLAAHLAGQPLDVARHDLFRRETDRHIQRTLSKTPLDVGADRIARTAHAALEMIGRVGSAVRKPIPLAWSPELSGISVIEVYPAATLTARHVGARDYKKPLQLAERQKIAQALRGELDFDATCVGVEQSADVLDAVICLLAAKDFLQGNVVAPTDLARAQREGWIWAPLRRTR